MAATKGLYKITGSKENVLFTTQTETFITEELRTIFLKDMESIISQPNSWLTQDTGMKEFSMDKVNSLTRTALKFVLSGQKEKSMEAGWSNIWINKDMRVRSTSMAGMEKESTGSKMVNGF